MVDYSLVLLLIMRPFKSLSIIAFLIINFVTSETFAQSFGLKIISVSDSSVITKDLQIFDSLWFKCMSDYGRNDVSSLFADHHPGVSKTNPITLLNFISGFDIPFSNMFGFRLIYNQNLNDTVNLYQLDMGWMQMAVLYNSKQSKLMRFESLNSFNLIPHRYKNLTVFSSQKVEKKELAKSYNQMLSAVKELGLSADSFMKIPLILYSGPTLKDAYAYVGGLEYVNFFNPKAQFGGMGDPFNKVVLSGIPKPVHVHELLHFAIPFKCNYFVGEGLASLYGGIGATSYKENLPGVLAFIKSKDIHTFSDAMSLWRTSTYFNSIRGTYVLSAYMLDKIRKDFPRETYRNFVRNCKTDEEMINSLKELYKLDSEEALFNLIFYGVYFWF